MLQKPATSTIMYSPRASFFADVCHATPNNHEQAYLLEAVILTRWLNTLKNPAFTPRFSSPLQTCQNTLLFPKIYATHNIVAKPTPTPCCSHLGCQDYLPHAFCHAWRLADPPLTFRHTSTSLLLLSDIADHPHQATPPTSTT